MERRDDNESMRGLHEREVSEGLVRAQREWWSVARVVVGSTSLDDAERRLASELGFSEAQSAAILCMPFRHLAGNHQKQFEEDLRQLRLALGTD